MTNGRYKLVGQECVPCDDLMEWADALGKPRHVGNETVGGVQISTVFLGVDHSFGSGPPLLFETMVFGGPLNDECQRYSTWEDAARGHADMVRRVRETMQMKSDLVNASGAPTPVAAATQVPARKP